MKKDWLKLIYILLVLFVFGFVAIGVIAYPSDNLTPDEKVTVYNGEWYRIMADGTKQRQEIPGKCVAARNELIEIETKLPDSIPEDTYLCFRSGKQTMRFYIDGILRQEYDTSSSRIWGSHNAVAYIFLKVQQADAGKILKVQTQTSTSYTGIFYQVYKGSQMAMWAYFFKKYGLEVVVAVIAIVICFVCIIGSWILKFFYRKSIAFTHLAWGVLFAGIWVIDNSVFRQLICDILPPLKSKILKWGLLVQVI